jgi:hypothetical protein
LSICIFPLLASDTASAGALTEWIDPVTGHRIIRLSADEGGSSLYFHQNSYTPKGDGLVFNTKAGIAAIDLTRLGKEPVKTEIVVPGARAIAVAWRTPDVYYFKSGALYATNLHTKATRKVSEGRAAVVNADETLVVGTVYDPDAPAKVKELRLPMLVTADLAPRDEPPGRLKPGGRSLALLVTDVKAGTTRKIHYSTEWLNHLQASPADPHRLLFCHEGAWHQVDRVWTIRTDGKELRLMHQRTMRYEIAGHEFFSHDGKWVWYDLQTPRSKEFWLTGVNIDTGERIRYPITRANWSVHYNISRDGKLFAGDGGGPDSVANLTPLPQRKRLDPPGNGQGIFLFTPTGDTMETINVGGEPVKIGKLAIRKLADLSKHDYRLEPNVTITPDNKWVVFRSNMHGRTHVYAVEVAKSDRGQRGVAAEGTKPLAVTAPPESFFAKVRERDRDAARKFYRKYIDVQGMPVVSSAEVADEALRRTHEIVTRMLAGRPDILKAMADHGTRLIIIGKDQVYTDMPEYRNTFNPKFMNERVRGTGGLGVTSFGEENLLNLAGDRYDDESIAVHEFCHTIDAALRQIDPSWRKRLADTYRAAMNRGLWKDVYTASNPAEYWAEICQSYFNCNRVNNWNHNAIGTREQLKQYDPEGYDLVRTTFKLTPANDWRYRPLRTQPSVISPPATFKIDPYYTKFTYAREFPVLGSKQVSDAALLRANDIIRKMFAYRHDVLKAMIADGVRLVVLGRREKLSDLPELGTAKK